MTAASVLLAIGVLAATPDVSARLSFCPSVALSVEAVRTIYDAETNRVEDDATPVDDIGFLQALAAPRSENDGAKRWRFTPPIYAQSALSDGVEATCAAMFDVATNGRTINIAVSCTDARFEPGVRRATANMLLLPTLKDGAPIVERAIAQPFAFCLEDSIVGRDF